MNKKAATLSIGMVFAVFIGILLLIFLTGGGISKAFEITKFLRSIPTPVWIVFGIIVLFRFGGKK